uniref:TBC1 domain family member 13 n=1 Tax=Steinernema glaseri TaxID=37863 RepID=A0A1I7XZT4_9BILA
MASETMSKRNGGKKYENRLRQIEEILHVGTEPIDYDELRASCSYGIPDDLRPLAWRILLNYLPSDRQTWKLHLKGLRSTYHSLIEDLIIKPIVEKQTEADDHPLSQKPSSEWNSYFRDNEVLLQIDKDVRRLYPEIDFFQRPTAYPNKGAMEVKLSQRITQEGLKADVVDHSKSTSFIERERRRSAKPHQEDSNGCSETHWQVVERILFIYSKLNAGIKYIQGMNEVIGPIYYVLASDQDSEWAAHAEADTYYCFQLLMSEIKDNFIKSLDDSHFGIDAAMKRFHNRLAELDPDLYSHIVDNLAIKPQFYAFRWMSLMLSQEFPLPDVITIWDALFADPKRFALLDDVMLAMMVLERNTLIEADFGTVLRLLQNYPEIDVLKVVQLAYSIRDGSYTVPRRQSPKLSARMQLQDVKNGVTTLISSKLRSFSFKK